MPAARWIEAGREEAFAFLPAPVTMAPVEPIFSDRTCSPIRRATILAAAALLVGGCVGGQRYVSAERLDRGLVIVLPGVEGTSVFNRAICDGLDEGGVNWAIELYDWTTWGGPFYNLRNQARNRRKAGELAARIVCYRKEHPNRPVVLVGQSGGGAIAVWAAGALPEGTAVDGVVLLAAAISPRHGLEPALQKTRRGIVSFYSPRDWVLLGTVFAGTMDGDFGSSAGRVGFQIPAEDDRARAYRKLFQIAWNEKMAEVGHGGGHLTSGAAAFVSTYVAPFVRQGQWNEEFVAEVLRGKVEAAAHGDAGYNGEPK